VCRFFTNSYIDELAGDVFYIRPFGNIEREVNYGTDHGTHYNYDTHVPLLFFGRGVMPAQVDTLVHPENIYGILKELLGY